MPPSLSAPLNRTIYIMPHNPAKSSQPSILAHRQLKLSPTNDRIVHQPLYSIPRSTRPLLQRAIPPQSLLPTKKRKMDCLPSPPSQPATPELVDIAEVYQLLGEHFGPDQDDLVYCSNQLVPRKRERLTNLTKEEKLHRRKLKNRVAAQTARDRKKERSQKLERAVRALLQETSRLRTQNACLQKELENLKPEAVNNPQPDFHLLPEVELSEGQVKPPKVLEIPAERAFGSAEGSGTLQEHFLWTRGGQPAFPTTHTQTQFAGSPTKPVHSGIRQMEDQEEAEDCELEAIFDDLFGDTSDPSAIHQFCNQVIEDEFRPIATEQKEGETHDAVADTLQQQEKAASISPTTQMVPTQWMNLASPTTSSCCSTSSLNSLCSPAAGSYETPGLEWSSCSGSSEESTPEGLVEGCEDAMFCTSGHQEEDSQMFDFITQEDDMNYELDWVDGEYNVLQLEQYDSSNHEEVENHHYFSNSSSSHPLVEFNEFAIL